jgi:GGDEF domain-containing protein
MVAGAELLFRATHDSLTGISNRGVILDSLRREHSVRSAKGARLVSFCWMSITSNR